MDLLAGFDVIGSDGCDQICQQFVVHTACLARTAAIRAGTVTQMNRRLSVLVSLLISVALVGTGCGGGEEASTTSTTRSPSSTAPPPPLRIMVTNDDGYAAPGIDTLIAALRTISGAELFVVAPAEDQTGTGGRTTDGPLTATDVRTLGGFPAKAVAGFPADTVVWAIDQGGLAVRPDLVVSGANRGQNLGPVTALSGTVGAARAAAQRGIPALAVSQGLAPGDGTPDYPTGVSFAVSWILQNRADLAAGKLAPGPWNLNAPTCTAGTVRGLLEVEAATDARDRPILAEGVDCSSDVEPKGDDVDAFLAGYAALSRLEPSPPS